MNNYISNNEFPHLPKEVQSLIAQNAPSTVRVETKSDKHGQRYKCYDQSGKCIGRIKGAPGAQYWQPDVGKYDLHHSQKVEPLDIPTGVSNNKFPHLPQEVQSLIAQNAPSTVRVETKSDKHGQRYKCYDQSGKCIGRIKGAPGAQYWQPDVGKYDLHHSQKVEPLDIPTGVSNNKFPHLPQEVQSLIAQNAPSTVRVETKSDKHGQRYKCYDQSGKCIGRIKGAPGAQYWQPDVGKYDLHHSQKVEPLDIATRVGLSILKSFFLPNK